MPSPVIVQECGLDDSEAALLWNWVLCRQGLAASTRFSSVVNLSHASLGLHAARLPSPYATALARGRTPQIATSLFAPETRAHLITVRCMRKTLHTLPLPLAVAAHGATVHFRERDAQRAIVKAGLDMSTISSIIDAIANVLEHGPLHHRVIETRLASPRRSVTAIRLALKLAWERGTFTYVNDTRCWNKEYRTFAITDRLHPGLDLSLDRDTATRGLIDAYFDRYGPATVKDAMWWSGLSKNAISTAMAESGGEWVCVRAPWTPSPMYMYRHRWDEYQASSPGQRASGLNFLAHEDVALKAYFETRGRYLGSLPARRVFNQIGEAVPTILHDGQVVGTWSWQPGKTVAHSLVQGITTPGQRQTIAAHATTVGDALRLGWSNTPRTSADAQLALL